MGAEDLLVYYYLHSKVAFNTHVCGCGEQLVDYNLEMDDKLHTNAFPDFVPLC